MTASKRRTGAALLGALVLLSLAIAITPTTASAAPFELRSCQPGVSNASSGAGGWRAGNGIYFAPILVKEDCPNGLGFEFTKPSIIGASNLWEYAYAGWLQLHNVTVTFESQGSFDGYRFTVRGCDDCDPITELEPASLEGKTWTQQFDLAGARRFLVEVECVVFNCPTSGYLRMHSVVATAEDTLSPSFSNIGLPGGWSRRGQIRPRLYVSDNGQTGLGMVSAKLNGVPFWEPPTCVNYPAESGVSYFTLPFRCPESHNWDSTIDLRQVADGQHEVTVDARDGAGNSMNQFRHKLKLDDTPPDPPYDITFSGVTEHGWSGLRRVTPSWQLFGLYETPTSSRIVDTWYDFRPKSAEVPDPVPFRHPVPYTSGKNFGEIEIPSDGEWDLFAWHVDQAGNVGGKQRVKLGRDIDSPPAPTLDEQGWFNRSQLTDGADHPIGIEQPGWLESGVCGLSSVFSTSADASVPTTANVVGAPSGLTIPANTPDGTNWLRARTVSCAGLTSEPTTVRLRVDSKSPAIGVSGLATSGWTADISDAEIRGVDDDSGVDRVEIAGKGTTTQVVPGESAPLDLSPGQHELTVRAVDRAANASPWLPVTVKFDPDPPAATFEPRTPDDPSLLSGWTRDTISGVSAVQVSIRPVNTANGDWAPLATELTALDPSTSIRGFRARIPDDRLAPGLYEVRVVAEDAARNRVTAHDLLSTGVKYEIALPTRWRPVVEAAIAPVVDKCRPIVKNGCRAVKKCRAGSKRCKSVEVVATDQASKSKTVNFGAKTAVAGTVNDAAGRPIAGERVLIHSAIPGGVPTFVGETETDGSGRFNHRVASGPNRRFTVSTPATKTRLAASGSADLYVKASATLVARISRKADGNHLRFRGKLRGLTAERSPRSVTVVFLVRIDGGWRPWLDVLDVDSRGEFETKTPYVLKRLPGAPRAVRTRVLVKSKNTPWPYENGYSNTVRVMRPK